MSSSVFTNNVPILNPDFLLSVQMGLIPGSDLVDIHGTNPAIVATKEDIWDAGGIHVEPTTDRLHALVSNDAKDDNAAGVGARKVAVYGLTTSALNVTDPFAVKPFHIASEIVNLEGVTPVNTSKSYSHIWKMIVVDVGSELDNAGTITATAAVDGTVSAQINPSNNNTSMAIFPVPLGWKGYMLDWHGSILGSTSTEVDVGLWIKPFGEAFQLKDDHNLRSAGTNDAAWERHFASASSGSVVKVTGFGVAVSSEVAGGFDLLLLKDAT